jgi:hypothetical protein
MSRQSDRDETKTGPRNVAAKTSGDSDKITAPRVAPAAEVARIRSIHSTKPRHGQKRRSSQRRHDVGVVKELQLHPTETPQEAARAVRRQRPPAEVIDVTEGLRHRAEKALQEPRPEEPSSPGLLGAAERLYRRGRVEVLRRLEKVFDAAARIVTRPGEAMRAIRDLRHREA